MQLTKINSICSQNLDIDWKHQTSTGIICTQLPDRISPSKNAIWKNVRKYQQDGTSLNLNNGRSGSRKTARTEEDIKNIQTLLCQNANVSIRKNGLPLSRSLFNRIILRDLKWHPYKIHVRHQLHETDLPS